MCSAKVSIKLVLVCSTSFFIFIYIIKASNVLLLQCLEGLNTQRRMKVEQVLKPRQSQTYITSNPCYTIYSPYGYVCVLSCIPFTKTGEVSDRGFSKLIHLYQSYASTQSPGTYTAGLSLGTYTLVVFPLIGSFRSFIYSLKDSVIVKFTIL